MESQDSISRPEKFLQDACGPDGMIVPVDPSDLKNVLKKLRELTAEFPGQSVIDPRAFRDVCTPAANVTAVWYRVGILQMMAKTVDLLPANLPAHVEDAVFNLAAKFPLKRMEAGVVYNELLLDVEGFMNQLGHDLGVA